MKISLSLCIFVLAMLCSPLRTYSQSPPEDLVKKLYEATRYKHVNAMRQDRLKQFFTPELIKNLPKSYEAWPIVFPKGQVDDLKAEMSPDSSEHEAFALVSYLYHETEWVYEYQFRPLDDGEWRISNIITA